MALDGSYLSGSWGDWALDTSIARWTCIESPNLPYVVLQHCDSLHGEMATTVFDYRIWVQRGTAYIRQYPWMNSCVSFMNWESHPLIPYVLKRRT